MSFLFLTWSQNNTTPKSCRARSEVPGVLTSLHLPHWVGSGWLWGTKPKKWEKHRWLLVNSFSRCSFRMSVDQTPKMTQKDFAHVFSPSSPNYSIQATRNDIEPILPTPNTQWLHLASSYPTYHSHKGIYFSKKKTQILKMTLVHLFWYSLLRTSGFCKVESPIILQIQWQGTNLHWKNDRTRSLLSAVEQQPLGQSKELEIDWHFSGYGANFRCHFGRKYCTGISTCVCFVAKS